MARFSSRIYFVFDFKTELKINFLVPESFLFFWLLFNNGHPQIAIKLLSQWWFFYFFEVAIFFSAIHWTYKFKRFFCQLYPGLFLVNVFIKKWVFSNCFLMNCFRSIVDRRKAFSLISSRDHCQISSPSRVSDTACTIWNCAEPQFRIYRMKLCSSDNHYNTGLKNFFSPESIFTKWFL